MLNEKTYLEAIKYLMNYYSIKQEFMAERIGFVGSLWR